MHSIKLKTNLCHKQSSAPHVKTSIIFYGDNKINPLLEISVLKYRFTIVEIYFYKSIDCFSNNIFKEISENIFNKFQSTFYTALK